ncbi:D-hexose-6-phosphate mutarotase [Deefgea piscis]|uniref:D-hexose-6-phosphate mutarotase n=1 Tax=Deefgea piscis TaxID=2739061 RepID=UPI001C801CF3|nr:D-hexose-6-phosphate mutarotase [Deefgea piscis]QZA80428.1 D-hexose-6-phosphate mutarotase [Deefgea piscis]
MKQIEAMLAQVKGVRLTTSSAYYQTEGEGLALLVVENALGSAVLALQGAHLISYIPAQGQDLLWLSPNAIFKPAKAIRGGIPLCMPWFGGHPDGLPSHGFARAMDWQLRSAQNLADGSTELVLCLQDNAQTLAIWPHAFVFALTVRVGRCLDLSLKIENRSDTSLPYTYAFHSYFAVEDYTQVAVQGLAGCEYIDTVGEHVRLLQTGDMTFTGTTDRVYLNVPAEQKIVTAQRSIQIISDTHSAVVWNPGAHAANIGDIGAGVNQTFVCVERGNVFDNAIVLAAGEAHTATMRLSV